jgi:hypothetical protein
MATVNLGSIKFKWKGTYSGATAYTVDDVVEYNGSSYICILASTGNLPTNATYFEQMSQKGADGTNGTNGTDLTTTLTTQGDLVYRDGSGLQRLGAGTSGQALITGGTGANPSWGTISSPIEKVSYLEHATRVSTSGGVDVQLYSGTFTKAKAGSKIYVMTTIPVDDSTTNGGSYMYIQLTDGVTTQRQFGGITRPYATQTESEGVYVNTRFGSNFNAGTITLSMGWDVADNTSNRPFAVLNPNSSDDPRNNQHSTIYQIFEVNE